MTRYARRLRAMRRLLTYDAHMTDITLYNTRTRRKEPFAPQIDGKPRMYVCGPTVYDRAHLGNARAMTVYDALFRLLRHVYGAEHVTYIRNITDVDDKINAAAKEKNIPISELTAETAKRFHDDMALIGCLTPTKEPRATEHITDMLEVIAKLTANGCAYEAEGHVLFDVTSYPQYGSLSNRSLEEMEAGARVETAPYKRNPGDFVLWKPSGESEPGWPSPYGTGRPGWHIECTAMSTRYLGVDFDIHGGGVDLVFPHHENETAQAVCAHQGSGYANFWVHNGFLKVNGEKMSKSLGNFLTPGDLYDNAPSKALYGEALRFALLSAHYRKPLNWNDALFENALKHLTRYYRTAAALGLSPETALSAPPSPEIVASLTQDLNSPAAFAALHALEKKAHESEKDAEIFLASLRLCGFLNHNPKDILKALDEAAFAGLSAEDIAFADAKAKERAAARAAKNWPAADNARDEAAAKGFTLIDTKEGTVWEKSGGR